MGKDSLIKSTTAKSGTKKKKTTSKKTTAKKSAAPKAKTKKSASAAGKKNTPPATKKTTAKAPVSIKDLLFKKFDSRFAPPAGGPPQPDRSAMSAPPLIAADDPAEVQRLRGLLDRRFSMADIKAAAKEPPPVKKKPAAPEQVATPSSPTPASSPEPVQAPPAPPKAPVSIKDLLFKKFDSRFAPPAGGPPQPDRSAMSAPPLIAADDPAEVQRLRGLLDRRFSMAEIKAAAKEPLPVEKKPATPEQVTAPTTAAPEQELTAAPDTPGAETPAPAAPTAPPEPVQEATPEAQPAKTAAEVKAAPPEPPEPAAPEQEPSKPAVATAPEAVQKYTTMEEPAVQSQHMSSGAPPAANENGSDPVMRAMKIGIAALCLVVLLILWASFANSKRYYISQDRHGMAVLQGAFSPTGKRVLAVLPGRQPADPVQAIYSRKEVFPLIFQFHLDQGDALLAESGLPDFDAIQNRLDHAEDFALNKEMRASVTQRRNHLQRTQLIHQAHVEISKDTLPALSTALQQLRQAQRLATDPIQLEAINQMITLVNERRTELQARIAAEAGEDIGTR